MNEFENEAYAAGAAGLQGALASDMTPDQAAEAIKRSRAFDAPAEVAGALPREQIAAQEAAGVPADSLPSPYWEAMGNPMFANFVKDDLLNQSAITRAVAGLAGTPEQPGEGDLMAAAGNSAARGLYGALNTTPGIGYASAFQRVQEKLDGWKRIDEALKAGKSNTEVFGVEDENEAAIKRMYWDNYATQYREELLKRRADLVGMSAWATEHAALYPQSPEMQELQEAQTLGDAAKAVAKNFGMVLANVGPESVVQFAPAIPLIAAGGLAGGATLASAVQGAYSYGLDSNSSIMSQMADAGVDLTDPEDVTRFLESPEYADATRKANVRALFVAGFDALAMRLASVKLPQRLPESAVKLAPNAARWYAKTLSAPFAARVAELAAQSVTQGALGGAGEAAGQLATDGEVTSWGDVVAEFAGEFFTAPVDVATASIGASRQVLLSKIKTARFREGLAAATAAAQQSKAIARDPQTVSDVIERVSEQARAERREDAITQVAFSAEALNQSGLAQELMRISPTARAQMENALATGGDIVIPASEYLTQVAPSGLGEQLLDYAHAPEDMTEAEADALTDQIFEGASRSVAQASRRAPEFSRSLKAVGEGIESDLKASGVTLGEAQSLTTLLTTLVGNMALDSGLTPEQVWSRYGARYFGAQDIAQTEDGQLVPLSDRAREALATNGFDSNAEAENQNTVDAGQENRKKFLSQKTLGSYFPGLRVITRWANADHSTFLHETGHLFLDMRVNLANDLRASGEPLTPAQQRLIDDIEAVVKHYGGQSIEAFSAQSVDEKRAVHEKFARGFEQYLYEGNAPTAELVRVFRRFKTWLKKIYAAFTSVPGSEMSDDVRVLYDRLFVSSEQVHQAALRRGLYNRISAYAASPTDENAQAVDAAWEELFNDALAQAEEALTAAGMRDMAFIKKLRERTKAKLTARAKQISKTLYDEAYETLGLEKVYSAMIKLKHGVETPQGLMHARPSEAELALAGVPAEEIAVLRERGLATKRRTADYVPADELANALGFVSVPDMAHQLAVSPTIEEQAQRMADEKMLAEYGEFANAENLERLTDEAIFNPSAQRLVATELDFLEGISGATRRTSIPFFQALARVEIGGLKLSDLKALPRRARTAATRHRTQALELVNQDTRAAAHQKRQELYQMVLADEAQKAYREVIKDQASLRRRYMGVKERESILTPFLVQLQGFMDKIGITKNRALEAAPPYEEFAKEMLDEHGALVPELPDAVLGASGSFAGMTYNQAREAVDFLQDLAQLGRDAAKVIIEGKAQELAQVRGELNDAMLSNFDKHGSKPKDQQEEDGKIAWIKQQFEALSLAHVRIPSFLDTLEGTRGGKFFKYIIRTFDKAADWEEKTSAAKAREYWAAMAPFKKALKDRKKRRFAGVGTFSVEQLVYMLFNMGNRENFDALIAGFSKYPGAEQGLTHEELRANLIRTMGEVFTKDQLQAAQKVWDLMGSFWPQIVAQEKRLNHRAPKAVKAEAITYRLAGGELVTLEGGYYPRVYDNRLNISASDRQQNDLPLNKAFGGFQRQTPYDGFIKQRAAKPTGEALALSGRVIADGLQGVIHNLAWREPLLNANKILAPKGQVLDTIRRYAGSEAADAVRRWLEDIASNGRTQKQTAADRIADILRSNVSLAGLGLNVVTAALQPLGLFQSIPVIGSRWVARGIAEYLKKPVAAARFARERSDMLSNRILNRFRELGEVQAELSGNVSSPKAWAMRMAYVPIVALQGIADISTWMGAYHKALYEGRPEAEAIALADRMTMDAQGSGRLMDLSGIERGNSLSKLLTVFYTFFNTAYNIARFSFKTKPVIQAAADILILMCIQPFAETFLREGMKSLASDKDDDDWLEKTMKKGVVNVFSYPFGLFVGLREFQDAASLLADEAMRPYGGPAGMRKIGDTMKFLQQAHQGELDEAFVRSAVNAAGVWFGLPGAQINRTISGASALANDKTDNPLVIFMGYQDRY